MQWELISSEATSQDPFGLAAFLKRMETALTSPEGAQLSGFTFLQTTREMFRFTRQIENDLLVSNSRGPLYVGFQNAPKADGEADRYLRLRRNGVAAYGFGDGAPTGDARDGLEAWYSLEPDHRRLENQWFLVTLQPNPIAFVGWEVSDDALWGKGGLSATGKRFAGFVSDDRRVVQAISAHLDAVRGVAGQHLGDPRTLLRLLGETGARRVLLLADNGRRDFLKRALQRLTETGLGGGRDVFLYDLSAESYLVSPYPDDEPQLHGPVDAAQLRQFYGRAYLAELLEKLGVGQWAARAILPYGVGFTHLAGWCKREQIDTVIIPSEYERPSLVERLRGYRLELLRSNFNGTIILESAEQGAWLLESPVEPAALAA